jgi:hypothetical protein
MFNNAPMHPYDYVQSFAISLCPYMWRTVMDPRVDAIREKKKGIDKKVKEQIKNKVKIYYLCLVAVVSTMMYYSF